jgi:hypothetical protein
MSKRGSPYEIGYGKPPRHTRFVKGRSGNPNGRPKRVDFARLVHRAFNEKVAIKENGERRIITKQQAALKQLVNKAASGDTRAICEMLKLQAALEQLPENRVPPGEPPLPQKIDNTRIGLALLSVLNGLREAKPPTGPRSEASLSD